MDVAGAAKFCVMAVGRISAVRPSAASQRNGKVGVTTSRVLAVVGDDGPWDDQSTWYLIDNK